MFAKLKTEIQDYQIRLQAIGLASQRLAQHSQELVNEVAKLPDVMEEVNHDLELFNFRNQSHLERINQILEKYH